MSFHPTLPALLTATFAFSACSAASAPAPAATAGIAYGPDPQQRLDLYRPRNQTAPLPAILLIHGGGWREGSRKDLAFAAQRLAAAGFVVAAIDYRLATPAANKFPAQLDDAQRAVRYLRANAATLQINPDHIGALGHSAGGHLAALLGTEDTRDNADPALAPFSSRVQAVVDTAGPTDFISPDTSAVAPAALNLVTFAFGIPADDLHDPTRGSSRALLTLASPALHVDKNTAPFLIVHGTSDPLVPVDQAHRMAAALTAAHKDAQLLLLEGEGHVFTRQSSLDKWLTAATKFFTDKLK